MDHARRLILFGFGVAILLLVAWYVRQALIVIYVSVVFAVVLTPVVEWVHRLSIRGWHPSRAIAILLLILCFAGVLTIVLVFAVPAIASDVQQFAKELPERFAHLQAKMRGNPILERLDLRQIEGYISSLAGGVGGILAGFSQALITFVTAAILIAYLILEGNQIFEWALSMAPAESEPRLRSTLCRAAGLMRRWLVGQALLMLILGLASGITFGFIGVRYFYLIALFAALANLIPLLGPIVTVILAGLVALMDSTLKLVGVLIFFAIYQQVENAYLTPKIMQSQVEISGSAILVALFLGSELAGVLGALVSVPSAVLIGVLLDEYARRKV